MTGGTVVILGEAGGNFGAGFTGGQAFVLDRTGAFQQRINPESLVWQRVAHPYWEQELRALVERHAAATQSRYAAMLLNDWERVLPEFWQVVPRDFVGLLPHPLTMEESRRRA